MSVRTRFAPSPTGYLHIGGVRTALFNWLYARKHGGQFILRIDDTDQQRNIDEALQPILDGFKWLGMDWDEGPQVGGPHEPYFQSQRSEVHKAAAKKLLASGAAYRDYATADEIAAERDAATSEKRDFRYSRRWMAESDEQAAKFEAEGRSATVRLKIPLEGKCRFTDAIRGDIEFDWGKEQDHVIQRVDGSCLYHLASVVDDHDFDITHVIRAMEHLINTPRQIFIAESLGYPLPTYAHIPVVAEPGSKTKLSKRKLDKYLKHRDFKKLTDHGLSIMQRMGVVPDADTFNPVLVDFYEAVGYQPEALVNYLLLLGWSLDDKTEFFTRAAMIEHFSLERVVKAPASFDPAKLIAFQDHYSQQQPLKQKVAACLPFLKRAGLVEEPTPCESGEYLTAIVAASGDRIKVAGDILDFDDFFRADDELVYDEKALQKRIVEQEDAPALLEKTAALLQSAVEFDAASLEKLIKDFVEAEEIKIGQIINALRVAVTGKGVGFGTFDTLAILGRDRIQARINNTLSRVRALKA